MNMEDWDKIITVSSFITSSSSWSFMECNKFSVWVHVHVLEQLKLMEHYGHGDVIVNWGLGIN